MKKLILFLFTLSVMFTASVSAQAHLGATATEIKKMHPTNVWKYAVTDKGVNYMYSEMTLGVYFYYFGENGASIMCMNVPTSMANLNTQIEIYNKKYVIVTDKSWKAYLEGDGGVMYIALLHNKDTNAYYFIYVSKQS